MSLFTIYEYFNEALEAFRERGGAMNYLQNVGNATGGWQVLDAELLIDQGIDPRKATEDALDRGGMSQEEIAAELADWQD